MLQPPSPAAAKALQPPSPAAAKALQPPSPAAFRAGIPPQGRRTEPFLGKANHGKIALILIALVTGLSLGFLQPLYGLFVLGSAGLLFGVFRQPVVGLGLMLLLGPVKAFLAAAYPTLPPDWGQAAFILTLGVWLARTAYQRPQVQLRPSAPLLALAGFTVVAALSLTQAQDPAAGLPELLKWIEMAVLALLVLEEARAGRAGWVVAAVLLAGSVQAVIGLWQFGLRGDGPEHFLILGRFFRAYGTFEQPNPFGGYMGLVWPVAAGLSLGLLKQSSFSLSSIISLSSLSSFISLISFLALALSFSRGAWLGAGAAVTTMVLFWPKNRRSGLFLLAGVLLGSWLVIRSGLLPVAVTDRLNEVAEFTQVSDVRGAEITAENFALLERLAHWQAAMELARAHPWLGVGLDNFEVAYSDVHLLNWPRPLGHAHNIYLNVLAETGVLGLMTYVILWGTIFVSTIRALRLNSGWRRGIALGLLGAVAHLTVHHLVDNLYVNNTHLYLGALLGLLLWLGLPQKLLSESRLFSLLAQQDTNRGSGFYNRSRK